MQNVINNSSTEIEGEICGWTLKLKIRFIYYVIKAQKCVHRRSISVHLVGYFKLVTFLISTELHLNNTYRVWHFSRYFVITKRIPIFP